MLALCLACAGPGRVALPFTPQGPDLSPDDVEVAGFLEDFEGAIAAGDWDRVRRSFAGDARVLVIEVGETVPEAYSAGEWLTTFPETAALAEYRRTRELASIERDQIHARTLVRSRLLETARLDGGRVEIATHEWMWIVREGPELRIGLLGRETDSRTMPLP